MFNVNITMDYRVYTSSGSKGSQIKYYKDGFWYKEDNLGQEGLVEFLTSLVLQHSSLQSNEYVIYSSGIINGKQGCRSADFTQNGYYTYLTLQKLYSQLTGSDLFADVRVLQEFEDRRDYVLDFFHKYYHFDLHDYLSKVFTLDVITLNEDRHFSNLGIFRGKDGSFLNAPIFDNGMSLLNGNQSIGRHLTIAENTKRITTKPFSGSPVTQYNLFQRGFTIDYVGLFLEMDSLPESFYSDVLKYQLLFYKQEFFDYSLKNLVVDNKIVGTRIYSLDKIYDTDVKIDGVKDSIPLVKKDNFLISQEELDKGYQVKEINADLAKSLLN